MGEHLQSVGTTATAAADVLARPGDHVVQFYGDDASLVEPLGDFIAAGLAAGEAVVVAATSQHIAALEQALVDRGVDPRRCRADGRYLTLDARTLLDRFMVDGMPDCGLFDAAIGGILTLAGEGGRPVRVFGEMVALLWADGNVDATMALEDCWNRLAQRYSFALYCAYPAVGLDDDGGGVVLDAICKHHSAVIAPQPVRRRRSRSAAFDLADVVRQAAATFTDQTPEMDLRVVAAPNLPFAHGLPGTHARIVRTLLAHAASSTRSGSILVSVGRTRREFIVRVRNVDGTSDSSSADDVTPVRVVGPVVDAELYVCKRLVERQGGRMWSERATDGGTTIGYAIPLLPA